MTRDDIVVKVLNLHNRKKDVVKMKKTAAADYRDQLKEIDLELDDTMEALKMADDEYREDDV